ncbi:MAG: restriction endonuclease subunit S [Mameliella sp.]|nr:restriction endonuclease subunit S [Phaeodactylibacter sp.]
MSKEKEHKKLVPELRFPEFNEDWVTKQLGSIAENLSNRRIPITSSKREKGEIPYYGATGIIDYVKDFIFNEELLLISEDGANLIDRNYPIAFSISGKTWVNNHAHVLKFKDRSTETLVQKFINSRSIEDFLTGQAQPKLNRKNLDRIPIPLAKKPKEQQKIAATLTSLDHLITAENEKLEALQAHKKGLLQQLFPAKGEKVPKLRFGEFSGEWGEKQVKDFLELLTDFEANGSFADVKKNVSVLTEPNFAWYVRATDLENQSGLDKVKYVNEHSYNFLHKTKLFGGELLITKRGEIGKVYFFEPIKKINATVAPNMYLLKMNRKAIPKFFYYYFTNFEGNQSLKKLNASSTIGALYKDDVKKLRVLAPSINEQQKVADCLSSHDEIIDIQFKKVQSLQEHKKGLLQQLFPNLNTQTK